MRIPYFSSSSADSFVVNRSARAFNFVSLIQTYEENYDHE